MWTTPSFSDVILTVQAARKSLEEWTDGRGDSCERVAAEAAEIRLLSSRLDTLPQGQSEKRAVLERHLWHRHRSLQSAISQVDKHPRFLGSTTTIS